MGDEIDQLWRWLLVVDSYIHHLVSFQTQDEQDDQSGNESLSIILDDDSNGGETSFPINSDIFLLVIHSDSYDMDKSAGILSQVGTGIVHEITQQVSFGHSDSASLSHVPISIQNWDWIGDSQGSPSFEGKNITLSQEQTGLLEVTYRVEADRWKLVSTEAINIVVSAYQEQGNLRASLTVTVTDSSSTTGPYNLTLKNFCTGEVAPSAYVWLDTSLIGQTNANGQISLGMLTPGEHQIRFSADGYIPSEYDHLNNDSFTVTI